MDLVIKMNRSVGVCWNNALVTIVEFFFFFFFFLFFCDVIRIAPASSPGIRISSSTNSQGRSAPRVRLSEVKSQRHFPVSES